MHGETFVMVGVEGMQVVLFCLNQLQEVSESLYRPGTPPKMSHRAPWD